MEVMQCYVTTVQAALYVGGHGERICQCREAKVINNALIPVQVDGSRADWCLVLWL